MSKAIKFIFGGTDDSAQKAQKRANASTTEFIKTQGAQAEASAKELFGRAQDTRRQGAQGALDVLQQTIPQQAQLLQQGNVGAQQAQLVGLPQVLAALQGGEINLDALQPQTISFNPGFTQQQLPAAPAPLSTAQPQQPGGIPPELLAILQAEGQV